jgi:hypothetical protein
MLVVGACIVPVLAYCIECQGSTLIQHRVPLCYNRVSSGQAQAVHNHMHKYATWSHEPCLVNQRALAHHRRLSTS